MEKRGVYERVDTLLKIDPDSSLALPALKK
jgi:hypothetical protein